MDAVSVMVSDGIAFSRTLVGLVTRPYETYRRIVTHGKAGELVFIGVLLSAYFSLASLVKVAAFRPFLLTQHFLLLAMGVVSGTFISTCCIVIAGRMLKLSVSFERIFLAWSYTLIPTVLWFFATSLLFVLLPPPRTTSVAGMAFSLLFLVFSATLLWWKVTLSYLTLRFGLKADFGKGLIVALISAPVLSVWSYFMYKAGIFKVPFL